MTSSFDPTNPYAQDYADPIVRVAVDIVLKGDPKTARAVVAGIGDDKARYRTMADVAIQLALGHRTSAAQNWIRCLTESTGRMKATLWVGGAFAARGRIQEARAWIAWINLSETRNMARMIVAREVACRGDATGAWAWVHEIERGIWRDSARDLVEEVLGPEPPGSPREPVPSAPQRSEVVGAPGTRSPKQDPRFFKLVTIEPFSCVGLVLGPMGWDLEEKKDGEGETTGGRTQAPSSGAALRAIKKIFRRLHQAVKRLWKRLG